MKGVAWFIFLICSIIAVIYLMLKGCSSAVTMIDGEERSNMINIINNYYFNKSDNGLWIKEGQTDSYKKVGDGKLDSLSWNGKAIIGYRNEQYFLLDLQDDSIYNFRRKRDLFSSILDKSYFQTIDYVPALRVQRTELP